MSTLKAKAEAILQEKEAKILPENIKKDVVAFGVTGELEELDTSDATALNADILYSKSAYVDGSKVIGTMPNNGALSYTPSTIQQSIPSGYTSGGIVNAVTSSIDANITAGNIKKNVSILGVTGTYEGSGGGSGDVKLFENEAAMYNDPDAQDGDLAAVYSSSISDVTENSQFQVVTFPSTVVLDSPVEYQTNCNFEPVDSSIYGSLSLNIDNSLAEFNFYGDVGSKSVYYTSTDGLTYIRSTDEETVDFGCLLKKDTYSYFESSFSKFMKLSNFYFGGLFEYNYKDDTDYIAAFTNIQSDGTATNCVIPNIDKLRDIVVNKVIVDYGLSYFRGLITPTSATTIDIYSLSSSGGQYKFSSIPCLTIEGNDLRVLRKDNSTGTLTEFNKITINLANNTYTVTPLSVLGTTAIGFEYIANLSPTDKVAFIDIRSDRYSYEFTFYYTDSTNKTRFSSAIGADYKYRFVNSQLTATKEDVFKDKIFMSNKGITTGTLAKSTTTSFNDTNAEVIAALQDMYDTLTPIVINDSNKSSIISTGLKIIPELADGTALYDTSAITDATWLFSSKSDLRYAARLDVSGSTTVYGMFAYCEKLTTVRWFDTKHITDFTYLFNGCYDLKTIPKLDVSSATTMQNIVVNCRSLSNRGLNNLLGMCASVTSAYTGTKTLKDLGLTSAQATTCTSLSNWAAAQSNGWSKGY